MGARPPTPEARAWRPTWAWLGGRWEPEPVVCVDGDARLAAWRGERVRERRGLLIPGLVNAHAHLELPTLSSPPGLGLPTWVRLLRAGALPSLAQAGRAVVAMIEAGTAYVVDVSGSGRTAPILAAAGLPGVVYHEVIGIDRDDPPPPDGTPHAPHTTHRDVIRACARRPYSIHCAEGPDEVAFLRDGTGAWPAYMRSLGRDVSSWRPPGLSPVAWLAELGALTPDALLVHLVHCDGRDLDLVAAAGATAVLCPRSNLHIGGLLPDVQGLLDRGVRLAVGTDSLASTPDLDLLAEAAVLRAAFPSVPADTWLNALTGPLPGRDPLRPGWLLVDCPSPDKLLDGTRWPRRWLACPGRLP